MKTHGIIGAGNEPVHVIHYTFKFVNNKQYAGMPHSAGKRLQVQDFL
jgi:hypothetical protein